MKLLISSNNQDKIKEIKSIFQLPGVELLTLADFPGAPDVVEDGNTLYENALKKASMLCEFSGLPTIADDTGLEVDSLGGHPGVYSARYAGKNASYNDNIEKLIREIQKVPENRRTARFRTVAVFYHPELILRAEGTIEGYILSKRRGSNGFGYDPIFFVPTRNKTLAEMSAAEKNAISHRGQAFSHLYQLLQKEFPSLTNI